MPLRIVCELFATFMMLSTRELFKPPPEGPRREAKSPSGWNVDTRFDHELLNFDTRAKTSLAAASQLPDIPSTASDRTLPIQPMPMESKNFPKSPSPKILPN